MKKLILSFAVAMLCVFALCGHASGAQMPAEHTVCARGIVLPAERAKPPVPARLNLRRYFTEDECEYFRARCNFTPEELEVFNLRVRGCSLVEVQMKTHRSESTVNRRIAAIKEKIYRTL